MDIPYGVTRHPPSLPNDWIQHARQTGWKLDANTGTFVGRPLTPHDVGRRKYDDFGPEDLLRFGAPGKVPEGQPSHWSHLVERWGLQVLNAGGFINGHIPPEHADRTYNPTGHLDVVHAGDPIHPVLRKDMWVGVKDDQWSLLLPSLHLATAILDTPDCLRFFMAYFQGYRIVYSPHLGRNVKVVEIPATLGDYDLQRLYSKLREMRNYTNFRISPEPFLRTLAPGALGMTTRVVNRPGMAAGTTSSNIRICEEWLRALELYRDPNAEHAINGYQSRHGVEPARRIHISALTTELNVTVQLAEVIIHELAHAVVMASVRLPAGDIGDLEPFVAGDRSAEAGYALEKHVFGGHVNGSLAPSDHWHQEFHAPYGLKLLDEPHWRVRGIKKLDRMMLFPVPAAWVASLFSRRHWEEMVGRFGGSYVLCPRFYEWATLHAVRNE